MVWCCEQIPIFIGLYRSVLNLAKEVRLGTRTSGTPAHVFAARGVCRRSDRGSAGAERHRAHGAAQQKRPLRAVRDLLVLELGRDASPSPSAQLSAPPPNGPTGGSSAGGGRASMGVSRLSASKS